jgi:hypothetical protein
MPEIWSQPAEKTSVQQQKIVIQATVGGLIATPLPIENAARG